jgi:(p)ppGpp synthase/HD superfamily hydrolase
MMKSAGVEAREGGLMSDTTTSPRLSTRFQEALGYSAELHKTQTRKASEVPYIGHLLSVAGLVIEADGTEIEAIAGLLHDAAEDQGGDATLAEIEKRFGADVAAIVKQCSDTVVTPKPPWHQRKENCATSAAKARRCGSASTPRTQKTISGTTSRCWTSTGSEAPADWSTNSAG